MTQLRQGLLPLDALDDQQFESFLLLFLSAEVSLEVLETEGASGSRAIRQRLVSVSPYGAPGRGGQRGIDLRAMTEDGEEWVFQCKHYTSGFTAAQARAAVAKAEREYPQADRYFLVISGEPVPKVRDAVDPRPGWELWGGSTLSVKFFNETPPSKQIEIVRRVFPTDADAVIRRLYPVHDDFLIDTKTFFAPWIEEDRIFHHRADLVGREAVLQALHAFVADPNRQVLILPAAGGVGKTRLLRAFGETFPEQHPKHHLWFVDPNARAGVSSDHLRAAVPETLVVVQDDAHRSEVWRADLVTSVVGRRGKLVFATRPHGVDALIGWLTNAGVAHARIQTLSTLPALSRENRLSLARACLPPEKQDFAEALADRAQGCTLIITVGAQLIADKNLHPAKHLDSRDFQEEVFYRLERDSIAPLTTKEGEPALRDTLRLLAVLAPWSERVLSIDASAGIIGITPRAFHDNLENLRAAGWLVETREGWRVVPDLFADHLVYRGCYEADGGLTRFALMLQQQLPGEIGGAVLRNLAEAEWQAQLHGRTVESLIAPFWEEMLKKFGAENFWERSQRIVEWRRFAVFQPERSLQLTRLAMDLDTAPSPPEDMGALGWAASLFSHGEVLSQLPGLLEQIATFHREHRWAALDLLLQLHTISERNEGIRKNAPLEAIACVAKFVDGHPADAPVEVVRWLADRLQGPLAGDLCDTPSPALALILGPVFERELEANIVSGRTFTFRSYAVSAEKTRGLRSEALDLIRDQILPRGEMAVLNALPVLDSAMDWTRGKLGQWDQETVEAMDVQWMPDRMEGLRIMEKLITPGQSPRVLYRILRTLRPYAYGEPSDLFKAECQRALALIQDTEELRLARVLLSNALEEFFYNTPLQDDVQRENYAKANTLWLRYADSVAAEFLQRHPVTEAIIDASEAVYLDYERCGLSAQFSVLFHAIARQDSELADATVEVLLSRDASPLDEYWTSLVGSRRPLADVRLREWVIQVLCGKNTVRWRAAQWILRGATNEDFTGELASEVAAWASRLDNQTILEVIDQLQWEGSLSHPLEEVILQNLNLPNLSEKVLNKLAGRLRVSRHSDEDALSAIFVQCFIDELQRFENLHANEAEPLWSYLANAAPRRFFEMLKRRVMEAVEHRKSAPTFDPMPVRLKSIRLHRLPEDADYDALAADLFYRWRSADEPSRHWWMRLFQDAVLCVSPLGLDYLKRWLAEADSVDEIEAMIDALKFEGSMIIFEQPGLVKDFLHKIRIVGPSRLDKLKFFLRDTASPTIREYTNHELRPEYRYYREAAEKAAEVHARDSELAAFYREIIRSEDADVARRRRWVDLETIEWE